MATQHSLITFTGKLGNLIGYERNGKYFLRSMPETVRQTAATRRAAKRFGLASKKAALIRHALYNDLDLHGDSSHINRLNKVLIAATDHAAITGFRFNQCTGIDRFFTLAPIVSRNGRLHIPPQVLAQYKDITALEVKAIATRIDFLTGHVTCTDTVFMTIATREAFPGADVLLDVPGSGTLIVTLQVIGLYKDQPTHNKKYQAADIIAVIPPQTAKRFKKSTYPKGTVAQSEALCNPAYKAPYQPIIQRE
jgi:hypothetical protein